MWRKYAQVVEDKKKKEKKKAIWGRARSRYAQVGWLVDILII